MTDDSGHFTQPEGCGLALMPMVIGQMLIKSAQHLRIEDTLVKKMNENEVYV